MIVETGKFKICRTGQQSGNFHTGADVANMRQNPSLLFRPFNQMDEAAYVIKVISLSQLMVDVNHRNKISPQQQLG